MIENPQHPPEPRTARAVASAATATPTGAPERDTAAPAAADRDHDPVADWLLERDDLDSAEFSVLFGIHKLRSRPGRGGWIGHGELCRSTGLGPVDLGGVVRTLRRRGLLGMVPHPVKTGCARYLLIVQA